MTKEKYIKTIDVCGWKIDLSYSDYGQCYYAEWTGPNGEKGKVGLGTYNTHYMEELYSMFDERYRDLLRKEMFGEISSSEWLELEKYEKIFEEEYKR